MMSEQTIAPLPIWRRTPAERYAHVAKRLMERAGVAWTPEQVEALERKISFVRNQISLQKPVAPILPKKIGEECKGIVHFYRVFVGGSPCTFVWSETCSGLITFRGRGEITEPSSYAPKRSE